MTVGSHKDAFKAHQLVKRLVSKESNTALAAMAAEILLDFVKSQRQINLRDTVSKLPADDNSYEPERLSAALEAVSGLCGACEESHDDSCFVNQARRVLIAAKTGADIGVHFDGRKSLDALLAEAEQLAAAKRLSEESRKISEISVDPAPVSETTCGETVAEKEKEILLQEIEALREKERFRESLIDEVVATIGKVSNGDYAAEMP
ncbi:MAG: hypothetical protein A2W80_12575 [Candidatus Riflebacteria bacterium GWC2_50_8]|nr:MAG: hypothetical protein A2W80_12575 [Candidatus Riflebacteria bacterium GWC2_50_8]